MNEEKEVGDCFTCIHNKSICDQCNYEKDYRVVIADKKDELIEEARKLFQECVNQENYLNTP